MLFELEVRYRCWVFGGAAATNWIGSSRLSEQDSKLQPQNIGRDCDTESITAWHRKNITNYALNMPVEDYSGRCSFAAVHSKPTLNCVKRGFVWLSVAVLSLTAVAKLASAMRPAAVLLLADPVFQFLNLHQSLIAAATLELVTVLVVLSSSTKSSQLGAIAWLSSLFLTYRLGLLLVGAPGGFCPCMGTIGGWLGVSDRTLSKISFAVAVALFGGSSGLLFLGGMLDNWRVRRTSSGSHRTTAVAKALFKSFVLIILADLCLDDTCASTVEVKGEINMTQSVSGKPFQTNKFWFAAVLDGDKCVIRSQGPNESMDWVEIGVAERHAYALVRFDTNEWVDTVTRIAGGKSEEIKLSQPVPTANCAQLVVSDGLVPSPGYGAATPTWIGYGSSSCFASSPQSLPPVCVLGANVGFAALGGKGKVTFSTNSAAPFLLKELVQQFDSREFRRLGLNPPFQGTFTLVHYKALEWTNVCGLTIPTRFEAVQKLPAGKPNGESLMSAVFSGTATQVVAVAGSVPSLEVPVTTRVVDRRPEEVAPYESYAYMAKEGRLLRRDEMRVQGQRSVRLQPKRPVSARSIFVYAIFGAVLIGPVIAYWVRFRAKNQT